MAGVGQALMSGFSLNELRASTKVPQGLIDVIRRHNQAHVLFDDGPGVPASGLTFYPYADPTTHTFQVRVDIQPGQDGIYPGMMVKVAFVTDEESILLVPQQAIAYRSEVTALYVISDSGEVSFRQVRLGKKQPEGMIELLAGVQENETVALDPVKAAIYLKTMRSGTKP